MSTEISLYQLRHQKARYELSDPRMGRMVFVPVLPRECVAALAIMAACSAVLLLMLCYACDMAVDLAQQAYGVTL